MTKRLPNMCEPALAASKPDNNSRRSAGVILRPALTAEIDLAGRWVNHYFAESRRYVVDFNQPNGKTAVDGIVDASAEGARE
jgi:hypothetical protein